MSDSPTLLRAEIGRILRLLDDTHGRLEAFRSRELELLGRTQVSAVFVAQVLDNYYTALETLFLRISQFFENHLAEDRWHADLLEKMMLHIPDVRERVIAGETGSLLHELRRFRHFKRYYFEMDFDWLKLDFLLTVYERSRPLVRKDLAAFDVFLRRLGQAG